MSSGVKGADSLSIKVSGDNQLDTLGTFEELAALAVAGERWISGLGDVQAAAAGIAPLLRGSHGQQEYETGSVQFENRVYGPVREFESSIRTTEIRGAFFGSFAEGKTFRLAVSPGTVALSQSDPNKAEKTRERATDAHIKLIELAGSWVDSETGEINPSAVLDGSGMPAASIWRWSARSRMRMVRAVAELDYSDWTKKDGDLAMVTLTLPGDWLAVAPDGKAFKRFVEKFRRRWVRAVGEWRCLWKLEFQRRGAPHMHLLLRVPAVVGDQRFERWLSVAWAECVGASRTIDGINPDGSETSEYVRHLGAGTGVDFSGRKFSDPRRIALYFLGHSMKGPDGKEYQHDVPDAWRDHQNTCDALCMRHGGAGKGPGRFWGFSGFKRAVVEMEISHADFAYIARQLRKLQRARDWKSTLVQRRGRAKDTGREVSSVTHRWSKYSKKTRAMGGGGSILGGWVLLNDALPVIGSLARLLAEPVKGTAAGWVGHVQPSSVGDVYGNKKEQLGTGPGKTDFSFPLPVPFRSCCRKCLI